MANDWIFNHFNSINLDIRESKDGTWIDQKCTPDVVCFVADCINEYIKTKKEEGIGLDEIIFTIKDIWGQEYSKESIEMFGKPAIKMTSREYDKLFSQPIKLLNYAQVIKVKERKRAYHFVVNNEELLEYVSSKDNKALKFLAIYIEKVLKDSDAYAPFEKFFNNQTKENFSAMKSSFVSLMKDNTKRGSKGGDNKDCYRIFTKVLNNLAYDKKSKGTIGGDISDNPILFQELLYNRTNFRDEYSKKPKGIERNEYSVPTELSVKSNYEIQKAKNNLRRYNEKVNGKLSECILDYAVKIDGVDENIEKNEIIQLATQMHHIFPQSQYPEIAAYLENLIALSPNQHSLYAHPENNTNEINTIYQYYLILCKIERIKINLEMEAKFHIYSFVNLIYVLSVGFDTDSFDTIEENNFNDVISMVATQY